jgi:hypothetical protein
MASAVRSLFPVFVFVVITGAMAFPICTEIDTGDYFGLLIALCKHDPNPLIVLRGTLQCIGWAGFVVHITFAVVDRAFLHDLLHFGLRDLPALHPAFGMPGVFDIGNSPVESMIAIDTGGWISRRFAGSGRLCLARIAPLHEEENDTQ